MTNEHSKSYDEEVAERFINALENGKAPWIRPWKGTDLTAAMPYNPTTNTHYKGVNMLNLQLTAIENGFEDPRWLTYKQAVSQNAQVNKGEKGAKIKFWQTHEAVELTDENGAVMLDDKGKPKTEIIELENPKANFFVVFNASQIDGLEPLEKREIVKDFSEIQKAEELLVNSGAVIVHKPQDRAFYSVTNDAITLPLKEQFTNESAYYSTALHELGHWSGHKTRLNRPFSATQGSKDYAREELRAEIGSYMLCGQLGLDFDPSSHESYVSNWVDILKEKPTEIQKASSDALKIVNFINAFDKQISNDAALENKPANEPQITPEKVFLTVPYNKKETAKKSGAKWDNEAKSWYASPGQDISDLKKYMPSETYIGSFKEACKAQGLQIEGEPIMNKKFIRVAVDGDAKGKKSGAYIGYNDGKQAGLIFNFKKEVKVSWKSSEKTEFKRVDEDINEFKRAKKSSAKKEVLESNEKSLENSQRLKKEFEALKFIDENAYLQKEEVPVIGVKESDGHILMPMFNKEGDFMTIQYIDENSGIGKYAKGAKKSGAFFKTTPDQDLAKISDIIVTDTYVNAMALSQSLDKTVLAAGDAKNMLTVATDIKEKYPNANVIATGFTSANAEAQAKIQTSLAEKGITFIVPKATKQEAEQNVTTFHKIYKARGASLMGKEALRDAFSALLNKQECKNDITAQTKEVKTAAKEAKKLDAPDKKPNHAKSKGLGR